MTTNQKDKTITSIIWKLLERFSVQIIQITIQILLARILMPNDFGLIAIVLVVINIAQIFIQKGFNMALIQKKEPDDLDYSSLFYSSILIATIFYIIIFFSSNRIGTYFELDELPYFLKIASILLFFGSFNSIQIAYASKNMQFKKMFYANFISIVISGTISLYLAFNGFGAWSLILNHLIHQGLIVVIMLVTVRWRPKLMFSFDRVKNLLSFGWKIFLASLIHNLYANIKSIIVGKKFDSETLGIFEQGEKIPTIISQNTDGAIQSVILVTLSENQNDRSKIKKIMKLSITINSYFMMPILFGLIVVARPLVLILLTDKWAESIIFLQLAAFSFIFNPIHTANSQGINSIGRSDMFLILEIIKKIIMLVTIFISSMFGLKIMALSTSMVYLITSLSDIVPSKILLDFGFKEQLTSILTPLIFSIIMFIGVYVLKYVIYNIYLLMIIQVMVGIFIYLILSIIFKPKGFMFIVEQFKEKIFFKRGKM